MPRRWGKMAFMPVLLALAMMISACAGPAPSTVTRENYDKLKLGMTFAAVTEILGTTPHHSQRLGVQQYTWAESERHIHAKFLAGRAIYFSSKGLEAAAPPIAAADTP